MIKLEISSRTARPCARPGEDGVGRGGGALDRELEEEFGPVAPAATVVEDERGVSEEGEVDIWGKDNYLMRIN